MDEVELGGVLGGGELGAQLAVAVVEDELVVAAASKFLGLVAAQRGGVGVGRQR